METVYAHLSKILVEPDQEITSGTIIGLGGNTGHSYGSHLHFEIRYLGKAIDAQDLINFETGVVKDNAFVLYKDDFEAKYDLRNIHSRNKYSRSYVTSKQAIAKGAKGSKYITIKNGDTLGRIAKRNHTTVEAICKKNGIRQGKMLKLGQKLKV